MKSPVQWCYDLDDVHEVMTVIAQAMLQEDRLVNWKRPLRDARDKLADLLESFPLQDMEQTHEREYLAMFDGLSYLTDAIRGMAVNPRLLQTALVELKEVFTIDLDDETSPTPAEVAAGPPRR